MALEFLVGHDACVWFAWMIAMGEVAVGIALIIGVFIGFAVLMRAFMNFNFLLAGSTSDEPCDVHYRAARDVRMERRRLDRVDRWFLPVLATPWQSGRVLARRARFGAAGTLPTKG